jgi:adenylylsulfate kinase-like enzyme
MAGGDRREERSTAALDRDVRSTECDACVRMRTMSGAQVLVLHGSPGSGKTTVAAAVTECLRRADVASALIDLDAFATVHPHQGRSFSRANLRAVWPNYMAVPDLRVVLPLVVVDEADLVELQEITAADRFIVCELTAPRAVLEERVIEREPNDFWRSRLLELIAVYHERDDHPAIRDFLVSTHAVSVDESAAQVISRSGWTRTPTRS